MAAMAEHQTTQASFPSLNQGTGVSRDTALATKNFYSLRGGRSGISVPSPSPRAAIISLNDNARNSSGTLRAATGAEMCIRARIGNIEKAYHINDLPNEVLVHMLTYLDVNDLLAISRVSHHFRELSVHPYQHRLRLRNARAWLPHALTHPLRPSIPELIHRRIYLTPVTVLSSKLSRNLISIRLSRRLQSRPTPETLVQRAVLWPECVPGVSGKSVSIYSNSSIGSNSTANESSAVGVPGTGREGILELGAMDPVVATRKRKIERGLISIRLSRQLKERPSPETLVQRAVLWPESVPRIPSLDGKVGVYVAPGIVQQRREVERERVKDMLRRWVGDKWKGMVRIRGQEESTTPPMSPRSGGGNGTMSRFSRSSTTSPLGVTQTRNNNAASSSSQGTRIGIERGRVSRMLRFWENVARGEGA